MPPPLLANAGDPSPRRWLALGLGLGFALLFCLGSRGLNEPDEGRYASMGLAMLRSGDWWEPRLSGFGHYDKPPLVYWAAAVSLQVFGVNAWAARLPSVFGALLALAGLAWTAGRLHGARVAWWAVLLCGTLVQFWVCARLLTPDMLLTGWCALGVGAWAECRHRGGAWRWWAASLGCWALAWWTKATPALVPLLGLWVGTWATGDLAGRRALRLPLLLPAMLVLGAPWFVAMVHAHPDLREFFLGRELAGRLGGGAHRRGGPRWYYLPISAVGWLPWWPLSVWVAWKDRLPAGWRERVRRLGVAGWVVIVGLVIFSLNGSKLPTYTLVLAPWAALGMARILAGRLEESGSAAGLSRPALVTVAIFALTVLPAAALAPRWESRLGRNASVREVCRALDARGAGTALFDQHWPGAEFYRPGAGRVAFVGDDRELRERASDPGPATPTFLPPTSWREAAGTLPGPVWTVRYRKAHRSPFCGQDPAATVFVVGDFELGPWQPGVPAVQP